MPFLAYFGVVGAVLLGLLFIAEARLGPPASLSVSTEFHGLPAPWKANNSVQILTARDAPIPDLAETALARAELQPKLEPPKKPKQAAAPKNKQAAAPKKKKIAKSVPEGGQRRMAQSASWPYRNHGAIW